MFIKELLEGYHFSQEHIKKIETLYNAKYMGYWAMKDVNSNWHPIPVDVFYTDNPDIEAGHTNYFGMYRYRGSVMITNAESAFSIPIIGVLTDDGEIIVSRYRHDHVMKGDAFIDGGRDYNRYNPDFKLISVTVKDGEFHFSPHNHVEE